MFYFGRQNREGRGLKVICKIICRSIGDEAREEKGVNKEGKKKNDWAPEGHVQGWNSETRAVEKLSWEDAYTFEVGETIIRFAQTVLRDERNREKDGQIDIEKIKQDGR